MKVFVLAMTKEAEVVLSQMTERTSSVQGGYTVVKGNLKGEAALVVISGVGKVNAAAATQLALQLTATDTIYNLGLCGGFAEGLQAGEVFLIAEAMQYDVDLSDVNHTARGTLDERTSPWIPCGGVGKRLGTGDAFSNREEDARLMRALGIELRDMEGAAIAQVCEKAGVKLVMHKCITNVYGCGDLHEQYRQNSPRCLEILKAYV